MLWSRYDQQRDTASMSANQKNDQNITLSLLNDDPRGISLSEVKSELLQMLVIPRCAIDQAWELPELQKSGVYILITHYVGDKLGLLLGNGNRLDTILADKYKELPSWLDWCGMVAFVHKRGAWSAKHRDCLLWLLADSFEGSEYYKIANKEPIPPPLFVAPSITDECWHYLTLVAPLLNTLDFQNALQLNSLATKKVTCYAPQNTKMSQT